MTPRFSSSVSLYGAQKSLTVTDEGTSQIQRLIISRHLPTMYPA